MKDDQVKTSVITGQPSRRGHRDARSDGMTWRERNKDLILARRRALYAANPDKHKEYVKRNKSTRMDAVLEYNRRWSAAYRASLRSEMISVYGGECRCCGETQKLFLQLDHVYNDGHLDRKNHKTSTKLLAQLKKQGWPADRYQLLCANCNYGKLMNGGVCPHEMAGATNV